MVAVTAELYREELVRDAFINGISSQTIRQRLLENQRLTLIQAYDQARTLDSAYRNAESYTPTNMIAATTSATNNVDEKELLASTTDILNSNAMVAASVSQSKKRSWLCSGRFHPRVRCPANDSQCSSCGKYGH